MKAGQSGAFGITPPGHAEVHPVSTAGDAVTSACVAASRTRTTLPSTLTFHGSKHRNPR